MTRIYVVILTFLFSASLLAQTRTFAGTDYSQGIVFVMENNQIVWQHKAPDSNDLWVLPNGNILFTTGHGVLEMTQMCIRDRSDSGEKGDCSRLRSCRIELCEVG